ncbi:MAG: SGNH/GDSL hydrolase family protein [Ornithinimicrobium sp.]
MTHVPFSYTNRTGRASGRTVRALSALLPGVADVQGQVDAYADAWHAHNLRSLNSPGRRWVVLGDSMSLGIGASRHDAGWVGQLATRLEASGHPLQVLNLGATGARVRDVLDQQLAVVAALEPRVEDLVTVMVGSNDLFAGRALRAELPQAYSELVDRVPPGSVVAALTQPPDAAHRANAHLERAATAGRIRLADLRVTGPPSWRGLLAADFFHPNDAGYTAIASGFEPTIRARLQEDIPS